MMTGGSALLVLLVEGLSLPSLNDSGAESSATEKWQSKSLRGSGVGFTECETKRSCSMELSNLTTKEKSRTG
jgi:hypothetical protein